jgi:hypothetical protein
MESLAYPTRQGVAISPFELELPPSNLNHEASRNYNNHHLAFTRKMYGKQTLYIVFRNLDHLQKYMLVDQHDWLHREYEPPLMPTPQQAIHEIERCKDIGEMMHVRNTAKKMGGYTLELITDEIFTKCKASYDSLRRMQH